jgi:hypothetical protein
MVTGEAKQFRRNLTADSSKTTITGTRESLNQLGMKMGQMREMSKEEFLRWARNPEEGTHTVDMFPAQEGKVGHTGVVWRDPVTKFVGDMDIEWGVRPNADGNAVKGWATSSYNFERFYVSKITAN